MRAAENQKRTSTDEPPFQGQELLIAGLRSSKSRTRRTGRQTAMAGRFGLFGRRVARTLHGVYGVR